MARKLQGKVRLAGAGALILTSLIALSAARGQGDVTAPLLPPMPAPFARDCEIGGAVVVESSLPNVTAALQERKEIKILAIGASSVIRRGRGRGGHTEAVEAILENAMKGLDVILINRGVSGELAEQAAARIQNEVALNQPDLVLWQVGTNDALAYVPLDELENTVVGTIRWLKEHKVDVVLVGLQYVSHMERDEHYRAVRQLLRKIAAQENVMIVRRYEAQRLLTQAEGSGGGLYPDEFARSEAGYICLAQYLARAIALGIFGGALRTSPVAPSPEAAPK